jgi:hypothetical protein
LESTSWNSPKKIYFDFHWIFSNKNTQNSITPALQV